MWVIWITVWHDSLICMTWLIHMCDMNTDDSFMCVTWIIHTRDLTYLHVRHDLFISVTGLIYMCDMNDSHPRHASFIRTTGLNHVCERGLFISVTVTWLTPTTWLIYTHDKTQSRVWTWLIYICDCDMTHTHDMPHLYARQDSITCVNVAYLYLWLWHDSHPRHASFIRTTGLNHVCERGLFISVTVTWLTPTTWRIYTYDKAYEYVLCTLDWVIETQRHDARISDS